VLGERLERGLYDLLATLIQAKYSRERTPLLDNANLKLEILRFQVRLAKDLVCLQVKSEVQATASDCELMPPPHLDHSQPARVWTSASARTVPTGCGSDDLLAQDGVAIVAAAVGMVLG